MAHEEQFLSKREAETIDEDEVRFVLDYLTKRRQEMDARIPISAVSEASGFTPEEIREALLYVRKNVYKYPEAIPVESLNQPWEEPEPPMTIRHQVELQPPRQDPIVTVITAIVMIIFLVIFYNIFTTVARPFQRLSSPFGFGSAPSTQNQPLPTYGQ